MNDRSDIWNFAVWSSWSELIYKESLSTEHIVGKGNTQLFTEVYEIDDNNDVEEFTIPSEQREFIEMQKGTKKYLLPIKFIDRFPLKPTDTMRIQLKKSDKRVFHLIKDCAQMQPPMAKSNKSFREFIDGYNPATHTNPETWTFFKIQSIAARYKGTKIAICSESGGGKSSNGMLLNKMFGDVAKVQVPTEAQFYNLLHSNRHVVFDEFSSGETAKIKLINNSILMVGDDSPDLTKSALAVGAQNGSIDLTSKSISFTYNRPQDLKNPKKHFDTKIPNPAAFRRRYPQLLLPGHVTSNMRKLSKKQAEEIMYENMDEMKAIVKEVNYFTENLHKHLHGYDRMLCGFKKIHYTNMEGVLDALDAYCESQEEYNEWLVRLNGWLNDYQVNLRKFQGNPGDLESY